MRRRRLFKKESKKASSSIPLVEDWREVRTRARKVNKLLLVVLEGEIEGATEPFFTGELWKSSRTRHILHRRFTIWHKSALEYAGSVYSQLYGIVEFPHAAILDPLSGQILWRVEGPRLTNNLLSDWALEFASSNIGSLASRYPFTLQWRGSNAEAASLTSVLSIAKAAQKLLFVYVQREGDPACSEVNKRLWRNDIIKRRVRSRFVFWYKTEKRHRLENLPHLAIVDPATETIMWKREGSQVESLVTEDDFMEVIDGLPLLSDCEMNNSREYLQPYTGYQKWYWGHRGLTQNEKERPFLGLNVNVPTWVSTAMDRFVFMSDEIVLSDDEGDQMQAETYDERSFDPAELASLPVQPSLESTSSVFEGFQNTIVPDWAAIFSPCEVFENHLLEDVVTGAVFEDCMAMFPVPEAGSSAKKSSKGKATQPLSDTMKFDCDDFERFFLDDVMEGCLFNDCILPDRKPLEVDDDAVSYASSGESSESVSMKLEKKLVGRRESHRQLEMAGARKMVHAQDDDTVKVQHKQEDTQEVPGFVDRLEFQKDSPDSSVYSTPLEEDQNAERRDLHGATPPHAGTSSEPFSSWRLQNVNGPLEDLAAFMAGEDTYKTMSGSDVEMAEDVVGSLLWGTQKEKSPKRKYHQKEATYNSAEVPTHALKRMKLLAQEHKSAMSALDMARNRMSSLESKIELVTSELEMLSRSETLSPTSAAYGQRATFNQDGPHIRGVLSDPSTAGHEVQYQEHVRDSRVKGSNRRTGPDNVVVGEVLSAGQEVAYGAVMRDRRVDRGNQSSTTRGILVAGERTEHNEVLKERGENKSSPTEESLARELPVVSGHDITYAEDASDRGEYGSSLPPEKREKNKVRSIPCTAGYEVEYQKPFGNHRKIETPQPTENHFTRGVNLDATAGQEVEYCEPLRDNRGYANRGTLPSDSQPLPKSGFLQMFKSSVSAGSASEFERRESLSDGRENVSADRQAAELVGDVPHAYQSYGHPPVLRSQYWEGYSKLYGGRKSVDSRCRPLGDNPELPTKHERRKGYARQMSTNFSSSLLSADATKLSTDKSCGIKRKRLLGRGGEKSSRRRWRSERAMI